jgi:hypothetical protein
VVEYFHTGAIFLPEADNIASSTKSHTKHLTFNFLEYLVNIISAYFTQIPLVFIQLLHLAISTAARACVRGIPCTLGLVVAYPTAWNSVSNHSIVTPPLLTELGTSTINITVINGASPLVVKETHIPFHTTIIVDALASILLKLCTVITRGCG